MATDSSAVQQNALLLTSKGQFDKAIIEWSKLLVGSPNDATIYNNIGDLHVKRNASGEAIEAYLQAGSAFQTAGSPVKAIAVYKKIIKLDPTQYKVYQLLGDLHAERGLVTNALLDYQALSGLYVKAGKTTEALAVFRTIVQLDPAKLDARKRLAELCLQENLREEAIESYFQLGKAAAAQQRPDDARGAYQAILKIDPSNARAKGLLEGGEDSEAPAAGHGDARGGAAGPASLDEATRLINAGTYEPAETMLSELLSAQPGDPQVCRLLAVLALKRGQLDGARTQFQFLAEAALRAGDHALAESMLTDYLNADAGCAVFRELLGQVYEQKGNKQAAADQYGQALDLQPARPDQELSVLPIELYAKIVELAPDGTWAQKFAARFNRTTVQPADAVAPPPPPIVETVTEPQPEPVRSAPSKAGFSFQEPATESAAPVAEEAPAEPVAAPAAKAPASGFKLASTAEAAAASEPPPAPVQAPAEPEPVPMVSAVSAGEKPKLHFELGVAYKNMGLLDEAIEELKLAADSPVYCLEARGMVAECLKEQGRADLAIACLEEALTKPGDGDVPPSLHYELGLLYEAEGQIDHAMAAFSHIPTFLDSSFRLERMKHGGEPAAAVASVAMATPGQKKRRISYL